MTDRTWVEFVLGGTRSGKSQFAEARVEALCTDNRAPMYIATAEPFDDEMRTRVDLHQHRRGAHWATIEASVDLTQAIATQSRADRVLLVDCLSVWLGNLLHHNIDIDARMRDLIECVATLPGPVIFVASEVGLGIVPENALTRRFRDHGGRLNQAVAHLSCRVTLVVAGQPLVIKSQ